jgi:Glycosyl transferases group 1
MKLRRVFALVPDCHVAGWRYAKVWQRHFYDGLERAGVRVVLPRNVDFGWARPPQAFDLARSAGARARVSEMLLSQILTANGSHPQAVLSCCFSHDVELDLVDRVRAAGIPWVNFFCDSLYAFDWVADLAARTSLNWFVESEAEKRYRSLGVPCLRAPYALNPDALPDASCAAPKRALLFVGAANHSRIRAAALLRLTGADLQVRGWGWKEALEPKTTSARTPSALVKRAARLVVRTLLRARVGGYLEYEPMLEELRQSAVVLGLNEGGAGPDAPRYLKLRDLEFPGMGCCYLAQYHADLADVYGLGSEVITFRTPWEAGRLAKDLARRPSECREIGRRARARVLREHTWSARLPLLESRL